MQMGTIGLHRLRIERTGVTALIVLAGRYPIQGSSERLWSDYVQDGAALALSGYTILVRAANSIAETLDKVMERFRDACCTRDTHAYTLHRLSNGRFGFYKNGYVVEMYCGRSVEALLEREGHTYWTRCTIEYESGDYYICGHYDAKLEGLVVRKAREGSDW